MVEESQSRRTGKHPALADPAQEIPSKVPDDMIDTQSDCECWPFLNKFRGEGHDSLVALYVKSDGAAQHAQLVHKIWVVVAAISAWLAVSLAIVQLAHPLGFMPGLELGAAVLAMCAFVLGQYYRKKWLTERHKAERCRLLKFSSMIRPGLWTWDEVSSDECPGEPGQEISDLSQISSFKHVQEWLADDQVSSPPGRIISRNLEQLTELRNYYREKRLQVQSTYYRKGPSWLDVTRMLPLIFFIASVVFVVLHGFVTLLLGFPEASTVSKVFIVIAACLPVAGGGIRIWRSAIEPTRNVSRFDAKRIALNHIDERMEKGEIKETAKAESVLRDLWCAEQIMESEHREWLRLMGEAEWQG
jgi:hypothetical protein